MLEDGDLSREDVGRLPEERGERADWTRGASLQEGGVLGRAGAASEGGT